MSFEDEFWVETELAIFDYRVGQVLEGLSPGPGRDLFTSQMATARTQVLEGRPAAEVLAELRDEVAAEVRRRAALN